MSARDYEVVAITYSLPETAVLLSMLRARGIWAYAMPEQSLNVRWTVLIALGGVQIRVAGAQVDAAVRAMRDLQPTVWRPRTRTAVAYTLLAVAGLALGVTALPARVAATYRRELRAD